MNKFIDNKFMKNTNSENFLTRENINRKDDIEQLRYRVGKLEDEKITIHTCRVDIIFATVFIVILAIIF